MLSAPCCWILMCHHVFCVKPFSITIHLINILSSPSFNNESPFTRLFGHPLDYSSLHIFGCFVQCAFLGYCPFKMAFYVRIPTFIGFESLEMLSSKTILFFATQYDSLHSPISISPFSHIRKPPERYISSLTTTLSSIPTPSRIRGNSNMGYNYDETFVLVAKMTTMRTILTLAASQSWPLHQTDVKNAFLHGDLKEEVCIKLPYGMHTHYPNIVCKLKHSLYGLKQTPRVWFENQYDPSLFLQRTPKRIVVLLVYVDDIMVIGSD
ncbi:hypothetical protein CR513_53379, partial [Mucuna pruriens]